MQGDNKKPKKPQSGIDSLDPSIDPFMGELYLTRAQRDAIGREALEKKRKSEERVAKKAPPVPQDWKSKNILEAEYMGGRETLNRQLDALHTQKLAEGLAAHGHAGIFYLGNILIRYTSQCFR